jgi:hypothetical protein
MTHDALVLATNGHLRVAFSLLETTMNVVTDLVDRLGADLREYFEERTAIRELDGGLPRDQAECAAFLDTLRRDPLALVGVTALRVEQGYVRRLVLTADADLARSHLSGIGATVRGTADLAAAIARFQGMAVLTRFG